MNVCQPLPGSLFTGQLRREQMQMRKPAEQEQGSQEGVGKLPPQPPLLCSPTQTRSGRRALQTRSLGDSNPGLDRENRENRDEVTSNGKAQILSSHP